MEALKLIACIAFLIFIAGGIVPLLQTLAIGAGAAIIGIIFFGGILAIILGGK